MLSLHDVTSSLIIASLENPLCQRVDRLTLKSSKGVLDSENLKDGRDLGESLLGKGKNPFWEGILRFAFAGYSDYEDWAGA